MFGAIAAGVGALAKVGYDQFKRTSDRSEKRDYLNYELAQKYDLYLQSLKETPSAQREGLEAAGYNPLMALGNIGGSFTPSSSGQGDIVDNTDLLSSAKQGSELYNDLKEGIDNRNDRIRAETDSIKDATSRQNKESKATIKNIEADTRLKESQSTGQQIHNISTPIKDVLANPLTVGSSGAIGSYAASKVTKKLAKKAVIKNASKVAAQLGSKALIGAGITTGGGLVALPLAIGSAAYLGNKALDNSPTARKMVGDPKFSHGNWSR